MSRQPLIIAYDISDDRIRRQVYRILLNWRLDGQKSVHECRLTRAEAQELFIQLCEFIDPATDQLLFAWLTPDRPVLARGIGRTDGLFRRVALVN